MRASYVVGIDLELRFGGSGGIDRQKERPAVLFRIGTVGAFCDFDEPAEFKRRCPVESCADGSGRDCIRCEVLLDNTRGEPLVFLSRIKRKDMCLRFFSGQLEYDLATSVFHHEHDLLVFFEPVHYFFVVGDIDDFHMYYQCFSHTPHPRRLRSSPL